MAVKFSPDGNLDVSTDPGDLPEESNLTGKVIYSGAMTRCENLRLDRPKMAITRFGSSKASQTPLEYRANLLVEQGGNRYAFCNSTTATLASTSDDTEESGPM